MNIKKLIAASLTASLLFAGCVSVESTRAQLSSSNPKEVQKAEQNILQIAKTGTDPSGLIQLETSQQLEYVNLVSNNALLLQIIDGTRKDELVAAAADKIDFSEPGIGMKILQHPSDLIGKVTRTESDDGNPYERRSGRRNNNSAGSDASGQEKSFMDKVLSSLSEDELRKAVELTAQNYELNREVAKKLASVTKDVALLVSFFDGDMERKIDEGARIGVVAKLAEMSDKIKDPKVIVKLLKAEESHIRKPYIQSLDVRAKLLARLGESNAVKYAFHAVKHHYLSDWNNDRMMPLEDAVSVAKFIKDKKSIVKIISDILVKIASYKQECRRSIMMDWTSEDTKKEKALVARFPKFADPTLEEIICADEISWTYFIDSVSADVAYDVLVNGKAKTSALEVALVKKLPPNRIDMKVYNGVKFDDARKAVNAAMPAEVRKQAAEEAEKAFAGILEKAKAAAKETFELNGFYLGMSFDDMKIVFAHYFPEWQIKEAIDGEGKDADHVIYIPGQRSPFCYASVSDKKVYQFNFGKKVLKKWYKYDVQTYMDWALAYESENKIDMKYKGIEKDTTVYEDDMSNSYRVWFHQESYQYKHNTKEYRLTYFGEEKDFTVEGGLGGAIIKEMAAPRFRYVRGDPGSLRARIERD